MSISKQVLIITYYWPPSGGAGVQRWLKFSKYLPEFNINPVILTVDPAYAQFPATDVSLADEISPDVEVYKTKSYNYFRAYSATKSARPAAKSRFKNKLARFIRGNFFIPDPRKGWNNYAFKKACELVQKKDIRHIITSGPPNSTHLVGRNLKRRFPDLNWIADFRDPWTDIYYYHDFYISSIARQADRKLELSVLEETDKILTVGKGLKALLEDKIPGSENKIHVIPNGYDESDFKNVGSPLKYSELLISYVGSINNSYPLDPYLSAIKEVIKSKPGCKVKLQFVGKLSDNAFAKIKSYKLDNICEFIDYSTHSEAIKYICSASILLLLIPDHKMNNLIITGKIYEYIRSGNIILGIGPPEGEAAAIIEKTGSGKMIDPGKPEEIRNFIINNLEPGTAKARTKVLQAYERKQLTSLLPDLL